MLTGDVPFRGENQVAVAMKHVRDPLPDVQERRPQISAALASVVDRATDKDLGRRYATAEEMIWDLEDALAIEASRTGQATGEATSVLRTLPERKRRVLPLRLRHRGWVFVGALAVLAVVAAVALFGLSQQTTRGTGAPVAETTSPGLEAVSLGQAAAFDYDPEGDDAEHGDERTFAVDGDRATTWSTETYAGGLEGTGKAGVGIYVDAKPGVAASALQVLTEQTGWRGAVYAARGATAPETIDGWRRLAGPDVVGRRRYRFRFDTGGKRYRYYLVWISRLPRDRAEGKVSISEITLYQKR